MKAKWNGAHELTVPGFGTFAAKEEKEVSAEQAEVLRGVNDPLLVVSDEASKKGKEK